jgi:hypothetical protein
MIVFWQLNIQYLYIEETTSSDRLPWYQLLDDTDSSNFFNLQYGRLSLIIWIGKLINTLLMSQMIKEEYTEIRALGLEKWSKKIYNIIDTIMIISFPLLFFYIDTHYEADNTCINLTLLLNCSMFLNLLKQMSQQPGEKFVIDLVMSIISEFYKSLGSVYIVFVLFFSISFQILDIGENSHYDSNQGIYVILDTVWEYLGALGTLNNEDLS